MSVQAVKRRFQEIFIVEAFLFVVFIVIIIAVLLFIYADKFYDSQLDIKHDARRLLSGDNAERPTSLWFDRNDVKVWVRIFSVLMILFALLAMYLFALGQQSG